MHLHEIFEQAGEAVVDRVPVEAGHARRGTQAQAGQQSRGDGERTGRIDERLLVAGGRQQSVTAVIDQFKGGGAGKGDDAEPAGHGLERDVAVGLGEAGEQEDVGRGIVRGEIFAVAHAGEDMLGVPYRQRRLLRAVADEQQP